MQKKIVFPAGAITFVVSIMGWKTWAQTRGSLSTSPDRSGGMYMMFPNITSKDLAGKSVTLPRELPAERTVILIAFTREQQTDIDGWVSGLNLESGKLPWLELPVIDNPGAIGRWFIDGGMRRGISNHETWKHVVTLYTGKTAFKSSVGISSEKSVYAMVVTRRGEILKTISGPFTQTGADSIRAELAKL